MADHDKPLSPTAEDVLSIIQQRTRRSPGAIAAIVVPDIMEEVIQSLSPEDRQELGKRLRKLFIASFSHPTTDAIAREVVAKATTSIVVSYLESQREKMERALKAYIDDHFQHEVEEAGKRMLEEALAEVKAKMLGKK